MDRNVVTAQVVGSDGCGDNESTLCMLTARLPTPASGSHSHRSLALAISVAGCKGDDAAGGELTKGERYIVAMRYSDASNEASRPLSLTWMPTFGEGGSGDGGALSDATERSLASIRTRPSDDIEELSSLADALCGYLQHAGERFINSSNAPASFLARAACAALPGMGKVQLATRNLCEHMK